MKELAICLNRLWTAARQNMQNVSIFPYTRFTYILSFHSPYPLQFTQGLLQFFFPPLLSALYLLYAKLEEEHGLARHAMTIYDRATKAVTPDEQSEVSLDRHVTPVPAAMTLISLHVGLPPLQMFAIYIKRAAEAFGITHTREIYEKAIEVLPNDGARYIVRITYSAGNLLPVLLSTTVTPPPLLPTHSHHTCRDMCLRYAQLETKLGEVDRARGIYSHGSQMSDPRVSG